MTMADVPDGKKANVDQSQDAQAAQKAEQKTMRVMKHQNIEYFKYRDTLETKIKKSNWIKFLEVNRQQIPKSPDEVRLKMFDLI